MIDIEFKNFKCSWCSLGSTDDGKKCNKCYHFDHKKSEFENTNRKDNEYGKVKFA